MKQVTFKIDNNTIQFTNNWIGNETIFVNGKEVSKKFSIFGTKHNFMLEVNGVLENFSITSSVSFKNNVTISLFKNGNLIEEKYLNCFQVYNTNFNTWFVFGMILILYSLILDDSKFLGILGLIFLILSLDKNSENKESNINEKD